MNKTEKRLDKKEMKVVFNYFLSCSFGMIKENQLSNNVMKLFKYY